MSDPGIKCSKGYNKRRPQEIFSDECREGCNILLLPIIMAFSYLALIGYFVAVLFHVSDKSLFGKCDLNIGSNGLISCTMYGVCCVYLMVMGIAIIDMAQEVFS